MKKVQKFKDDLTIILRDSKSNPIIGAANIQVSEHNGSLVTVRLNQKVSSNVNITFQLEFRPGSTYSIKVTSDNYQTSNTFAIQQSNGPEAVVINLAINPRKVTEVIFSDYELLSDTLRNIIDKFAATQAANKSGKQYYNDLENFKKAGLFNIYTKMMATVLINQKTTFDYIEKLIEIRPARLFAVINPELISIINEMVALGSVFKRVNGSDHKFPEHYKLHDSYKTFDQFGNLQLTIAKHSKIDSYIIDADIDNSSGLLHVFDVIEHKLLNRDSHPYDIREILLKAQNLDPGYQLIV